MGVLEANTLDSESKFAKVLNDLRYLRPFYSAVYESLERVESDAVDTMGVNTTQMIYNAKFVDLMTYSELMFINLHEIAHVALMHVSRRQGRDTKVWNIAADLYANKMLSEEFNINPGETDDTGMVTFQKNGLFCSSIDLDKDTTEEIYYDIMSQMERQGYKQGEPGAGTKTYKITYRGSLGNEGVKPEFNLNLNVETIVVDIFDKNQSSTEAESENRRILSEAKVRNAMRDAGNNSCKLEIHVDEILKSHIDWIKLLRKYCISIKSKDSSFSKPDKRMYYQNAIYPGQCEDGELSLKNVKICFDASGSITDEDLAYFYGQIKELMDSFKLDAEVIYWDTEVESIGLASNLNELRSIGAFGRGGTDPSCIFEYFDSKKCKVKPSVTIVFTDGYILPLKHVSKWKRRYKDTIWVMTKEYNKDFDAGFGTITLAKYSSKQY